MPICMECNYKFQLVEMKNQFIELKTIDSHGTSWIKVILSGTGGQQL